MKRVLVVTVLCVLAMAGSASAQEPAPEPDIPETVGVVTTTSTTLARPTTTLSRCEPPAPLAATFVGRPHVRAGTRVSFAIDERIDGAFVDDTVEVEFPRDERFIRDGVSYRVAASLDAEAQVLVSKVRALRGVAAHCVAKDPIFSTLPNGERVDTGVFSGMNGRWRTVPLAFVYPLSAVVVVLGALSMIRRSVWWVGRRVRSGRSD